MIAKQIKGRDFYGVLAYNQKKVDKGLGCVIDRNITDQSVIMQTREFNSIRQLKPNLSRAVYHTSLSLPYSDNLSDENFSNLAQEYLQGMGFDDNQYIVYKHTDQNHPHIHIVANRVKYNGDVVSDSHDFKKSEALVRKLEIKYNLTTLPKKRKLMVFTTGEKEKATRLHQTPERLELFKIIIKAVEENTAIDAFTEDLKKQNIEVHLNSAVNGTVSGISFRYKNINYKGSKIHRKLSWNNLKKIINYEQNRIHTTFPAIDNTIGGIEKGAKSIISRNQTSTGNTSQSNTKPSYNLEQTKQRVTNRKPRR